MDQRVCEVSRRFDGIEVIRGKIKYRDVEQGEIFKIVNEAIAHSPVLALPNQTDPFILDTDASDVAVGAELIRVQNGKEKVVAHRSFTGKEEGNVVSLARCDELSVDLGVDGGLLSRGLISGDSLGGKGQREHLVPVSRVSATSSDQLIDDAPCEVLANERFPGWVQHRGRRGMVRQSDGGGSEAPGAQTSGMSGVESCPSEDIVEASNDRELLCERDGDSVREEMLRVGGRVGCPGDTGNWSDSVQALEFGSRKEASCEVENVLNDFSINNYSVPIDGNTVPFDGKDSAGTQGGLYSPGVPKVSSSHSNDSVPFDGKYCVGTQGGIFPPRVSCVYSSQSSCLEASSDASAWILGTSSLLPGEPWDPGGEVSTPSIIQTNKRQILAIDAEQAQ